MKQRKIIVGGLCVLLLFVVLAGCVTTNHIMVPMHDGVHLATDVYVKQQNLQHGSILIRTPYNKGTLPTILLGTNLAQNGWPTIIQDTRGRFASEGTDTVFRTDRTDGPDTLAWIANQTWSNKKVATWGGSALGITQYMAAGANPPQLACQYIQVATPDLYKHAMYPGGEFRKILVEGWLNGQGSTYILPELWAHENYTMDYWTNVSLEDKWEQVNVPAIHIGGWYDIFTQGTIDGFLGYQHKGGPGAQGKSKLILGPWTHGGAGITAQGELTYPTNSIDNFSQALFWQMVDEYTMDGPADFDSWPAVTYYVMGDVTEPNASGNEWRYANDWPLPSVERAWYLQPDGSLQTTAPTQEEQFTFEYDPTNPVPTLGGGNLNIPAGPYDQRSVENRSDVLLFTSPPLEQPYEATGAITARLFVSSDCPDTDFTVKLTDVYPDGRSMLITDGILRMRNRNGCDHWELMEPGTIYPVDVDLWSTSYVWNTGHQIRVGISSSNYPRCLNNPNTAEGIYQNTTSSVAQNTVYVDSIHSSCLLLPEIPQNSTVQQQRWIPFAHDSSSGDGPTVRQLPERLQNILRRCPALQKLFEYRSFFLK